MKIDTAFADLCRATVAAHRERILYVRPRGGAPVTLADGYIPLLANYTAEDKEAKGLRSLAAASEQKRRAVHFTALERVGQERLLLLLGEHGSGKTTFAIHLALHLAGEALGLAEFNVARMRHVVPRNGEGDALAEAWPGEPMIPLYLPLTGPGELRGLIETHWPGAFALLRNPGKSVLLIVDEADRLGDGGPAFLVELAALAQACPRTRVLVCGEARRCRDWTCPAGFVKESLLPLLACQRAGRGEVAANPAMFGLSQGLDDQTGLRHAHELFDRWAAAADGEALRFAQGQRFFQIHIEGRRLAGLPPAAIAAAFARDPQIAIEPTLIAARRLSASGAAASDLVRSLVDGGGEAGAVAAADILAERGEGPSGGVVDSLAAMIEQGQLPLSWRADGGRHLARWGDPRDLEALIEIPAGPFEMGSAAHPNSDPPHELNLRAYRIGRFPVTNALYSRFVEATGRPWNSNDGRRPERANAPAVDLTWRDACAYGEWLTTFWRRTGRIGTHEFVRLPTEPEWEKAARGNRAARGEEIVYPWAGAWQPDRQNAEDAGINDTCTVGLFPAGRSPYGCLDMSGQVWEWTTTLWGDDMATPSWRYPYRDDGREDLGAGPRIRRVLRGGCFSSARFKACCTYRGSLEPDGFWRGNGFRIVVAPRGPA